MGTARRFLIVVALIGTGLLTACDSTGMKEDIGTVVGLVVGVAVGVALGGNDFGAGDAAAVGTTMVAGFLGGIIGNSIGRQLDEADLLKATRATQAALSLPKGETVEWESDEPDGGRGEATAVTEPVENEGKTCRKVREVVIVDGREAIEVSEYCKSAESGNWRLVG